MSWVKELYSLPKWKKYSQANEECYLAHIFRSLNIENGTIVELGAWDGFHLSNTRYFIEKGFQALLIDGDNHGNEEVKQHFITAENVVSILQQYEQPKVFDLLCIDLDGNDIYILDKILTEYKPKVIIAEFNPIWSATQSKAIQYNPEHTWNNDDYYGFSFLAGMKMAYKHGYTCIFQNDNLNMYFVENNVLAQSLIQDDYNDSVIRYIPSPSYYVSQYHPKSNKTTWVDYE